MMSDGESRRLKILGVDPALRCTGYGLIEVEGRKCRALDCGVIRNRAKDPLSECLRRVAGGIRELVDGFAPDIAVVEGSFYFKNAKTAMVLGMARGAIVSVLAESAVPVYEYAPRSVKQTVVGYGDASKEQVATFIANMLHLDVADIPNDATDGMAIAVCHALMLETAGGAYMKPPI